MEPEPKRPTIGYPSGTNTYVPNHLVDAKRFGILGFGDPTHLEYCAGCGRIIGIEKLSFQAHPNFWIVYHDALCIDEETHKQMMQETESLPSDYQRWPASVRKKFYKPPNYVKYMPYQGIYP